VNDDDIEYVGGNGGNILAHIPAILKQRKWWVIVPAVLCSIAGVASAFLLPTTYRSSAVLLVESPMLPEEVAGQGSPDIIDQRIAKVRQQVLSRPDLIELIERLDLYASEKKTTPLSTIIEDMRKAASFEPVSAEIQQRGGGRSSTIAFSMSFNYRDPIKAQQVAQDLVERTLRIDSTQSAEQAESTVRFLTEQSGTLQSQIALLEQQIAGIKARNGLALSSAGAAIMGSGGSYDAQIAALQRDNALLNTQRDLTKTAADRDPVVSAAETQLASARAVYAETHPDVVIAKQRLAEARELAKKNVSNLPIDTIASQIAFNNSQIATLQAAKARDIQQSSAIVSSQARAPLVMEQVAQLQQKLDGLNVQNQQVAQRLLTAQAGSKMASEQKGERLSVIDPPVVPDQPSWPDRPKFILGGIAAGLLMGFGLAFLIEIVRKPIRGFETIRSVTGYSPLVAIPVIPARSLKKLPWYSRIIPRKFRRSA
jgi:polysaccharide biosynthesis transport protein